MISDHENSLTTNYSLLSRELRFKSNDYRCSPGMRYSSYAEVNNYRFQINKNPSIVEKPQITYSDNNLSMFFTKYNGVTSNHMHIIKEYKYKHSFQYIDGGDYRGDLIYYDEYKGFKRINIQMHGSLMRSGGEGGGLISLGGNKYNYKKVVQIAKNAAENEDFDCVRLLICHSADGGVNSIISNVSRVLQKPVKGYAGIVVHSIPSHQDVSSDNRDAINRSLGRSTIVKRLPSEDGVVRYVRPGKTVMAGFEYF